MRWGSSVGRCSRVCFWTSPQGHSGAHQRLNTHQSDSTKNPPPGPPQKLPKVIRVHLPSDSDLDELTLISPPTCLKCLLFLIKLPKSGCGKLRQHVPKLGDRWLRRQFGNMNKAGTDLERWKIVFAVQRWPVVVPSSPAVPQQQHGPNVVQMSEPSSFNISLTLHQSYQASPRFRLDKISQDCGKKKDECLQLDFAVLWNQHHHVEAACSLKNCFSHINKIITQLFNDIIQKIVEKYICFLSCAND